MRIAMNNNLSCVILCKNEGYELAKCINDNQLLKFIPTLNIVIINSSDDENFIVEKNICKDFNIEKFICKKIGDQYINGIADLRNFGSYSCPTTWVLHIDVDELFSDKLFENIDNIVNITKKDNKEDKNFAYKFPRINLPFYEQYPDYQTRLIHREKCVWEGDVHEVIKTLEHPNDHFLLREYPIIHKDVGLKSKTNKNIRWNKSIKNILICTLFKNGEKYLDRFLDSLKNEIYNIINQNNQKTDKKIYIELCFLEGNSTDNTLDILNKFCTEMKDRHKINYILDTLNLNESLSRFQKLAISRNMLIKLGLKNKHHYVLMIDSDIIFDKKLIIKLMESIERNNADVVMPLITIEKFRTFDNSYFYDTLASIDENGKNLEHNFPYFFTGKNNNNTNENIKKIIYKIPIEMKSVGTCYLTKADIYNLNDFQNYSINKCYKEIENGNKIIYKYEGNNKSEQIEFFENLNSNDKNKHKIILDPSIKLLHINLENIGLKWH